MTPLWIRFEKLLVWFVQIMEFIRRSQKYESLREFICCGMDYKCLDSCVDPIVNIVRLELNNVKIGQF